MIDEVVCFTDGSRLEHTGRTGASVFIESHNIKQVVPLGHYATVFQAEVYAIRICVLYLCDEVNASIAICSDSQAALKALSAAKTTSQLVLIYWSYQVYDHICNALPAFAGRLTVDDRNRISAISRKALRRGDGHTYCF